MDKQCCESMRINIDGETAINYIPKFREYGIDVCDGGSSHLIINFCPWCGPDDENLPEEMKTSAWWINKGL